MTQKTVLSLPEIASLVCKFSSQGDCTRIARVSRALFKAAAPVVWAYVSDVGYLLALLEHAEFKKSEFDYSNVKVKIALTATHTMDQSFSRFDTYAAYVKALCVYGMNYNGRPRCHVEGWSNLLSRARHSPLLPNLRSIRIELPREHPPDYFMWIIALSSPSLTHIIVESDISTSPPIFMSYKVASLVLAAVMRHQPSLQRLDLYAAQEVGANDDDGESFLLALIPTELFYRHINNVHTLRHLCGTCAWFQEEPLVILSQLPVLETIDLHINSETPHPDMNSLLSDNSFPALRRLIIDTPFCDRAITFMSTPNLVKRLTSLSLAFESRNLTIHDHFWTPWPEIFCNAIAHTPHLKSLEILLTCLTFLFPINKNMLNVLSKLPLQTLILGGVAFDEDTGTDATIQDMIAALPKLTELRLLHQEVTLSQLLEFGRMPNLRHLELKLDFSKPVAVSECAVSSAPIECIEGSREGGEMCKKKSQAHLIARNLKLCWPNLKRIEWRAFPISSILDMLDLINEELEPSDELDYNRVPLDE
ncbi:hypothetical protein RhiJN_23835 [Ceratobasidium sp. AG-Ba]|nr:hypothetical protein RhiJN_23835 [Ceratobasidium sp. AG-Ba]